ncbi:hydroxymethylglutaryl-CoA reductase (NADPH), partial [Bacteroidales bacterium OttesenSCG-928-L03]|nr:hydroxymethylglutaryl-CoA reductase (NADPH) [Bacteroidales bacterium OttesenSCG-928-L03]
YAHADVDERRKAVEEFTGTNLESISKYCFDSEKASKNIENMIGATQIPLGFAGPVKINGDSAKGEFLVPLATTEGALTASISRGMSVINDGGGATVKVFQDGMTRAPVFRTNGVEHCQKIMEWIDENMDKLSSIVDTTTNHGKLTSVDSYPSGRSLFIRFTYETGDAMGMNMATIATEAACKEIEENTGAIMVSVSGNMCSDKKPAAINVIKGRGKTVIAEALIPKEIVEKRLHATTDSIVETHIRKNLVGSSMSVTLGANAHAANMVAAVYIATGQDPAQVVSGSMTMTTCENLNGDLYISVRMPSLEVGTVGGGTRLPSQSEALNMIGCLGDGKARKLAEIVAVTVLAGELSTISAQAAGHLGKAHQELGR